MGSKFVAYGIWQIGLPRIIASNDAVLLASNDAVPAVHCLLQSSLTEVLRWLVRMVEAIDDHKGTAEHADQVRRSDPTQRTLSDDNRKRKLRESSKALATGRNLAQRRDDGAVDLQSLSASSQQAIGDYDTGRLQSKREANKAKPLMQFRL